MNRLKLIFLQTSMISVGIFFCVGMVQVMMHLMGKNYITGWYFIPSVIFAGFLCSLLSLILYVERIKPFFLRIVIHFLLLYAAVSLLGFLFDWYSGIMGYLIVMLIFVLVYVFVWIVTKWIYQKDDEQINNALDGIRDAE